MDVMTKPQNKWEPVAISLPVFVKTGLNSSRSVDPYFEAR